MANLSGKVCLVTGGGSGLGRAIALQAGRAGASLIISDIQAEGGAETIELLHRAGMEARFHESDVTQEGAVSDLIAFTLAAYGRLDCAFNNAGIEGAIAGLAEYSAADWNRVISVNLTGVFYSMRAEIRAMLTQDTGGAIVNIASTASFGGIADMPAYSASKHAVLGLTRAAALGYADRNIRINAICPGSFLTPMSQRIWGDTFEENIVAATPMRRAGSLEEIASGALWLASGDASFVTGVALSIDGGKRAR